MIVKGEVKMSSRAVPRINSKVWSDGGYFGELQMLQMGCGGSYKQAWYTAVAVVDCDLCCLQKASFDELTADFPELLRNVQHMARKRAQRFEIPFFSDSKHLGSFYL